MLQRSIKEFGAMFRPSRLLDAYVAWARVGFAVSRMSLSAAEVIARRSAMMASGAMSGPEAARMLAEKPAAFAAAAQRAAIAAASGRDPARIAEAALKPLRAKAAANARRLRR
jgi:hypothetical protein